MVCISLALRPDAPDGSSLRLQRDLHRLQHYLHHGQNESQSITRLGKGQTRVVASACQAAIQEHVQELRVKKLRIAIISWN
jgi:hypothetical protein